MASPERYGHCFSRDCLRGSSAADRATAELRPSSFDPSGCECDCQPCVSSPKVIRIDHDHHAIDIMDNVNKALKTRGLAFKDVSPSGADYVLFEIAAGFAVPPKSDDSRPPCTLANCGHMRQLDAIADLLGMPRGARSVLDELRARQRRPS